MNRRDFLHRRVAAAAGHVLGTLDELLPGSPREQGAVVPTLSDATVLHFSRRAMASVFEVILPFGTSHSAEAANLALDEIDRLETQLTVYRDTSEVSRLNRLAPYTALMVEDGLFDLLETAARITQESEGAFDVTAGALIKAWGFFRGPRRVPSEEERCEVLQRVGMELVDLDRGARTVRYRRPGLEINLGSIGKGYAIDRAAALLCQEWQIPSALLHGGYSSLYAIGTAPGNRRGWPIGLRHPWDPERRLGVLWLRDRALGTSASTFRHLEHNGQKLGHILDPRTGWPASGLSSVSVVAPTATEADALATAFFIQGMAWARRYCEKHPAIGAVFLPEGRGAVPVAVGLAPHDIDLVPGKVSSAAS